MNDPAIVVLMTAPSEEVAAAIARDLVERRLAACGNLVPVVRSIYSWEGRVCDDRETLVVLKTTRSRFEAMRARIAETHAYTCPEVLAIDVVAGHPPYLDWLAAQVSEGPAW